MSFSSQYFEFWIKVLVKFLVLCLIIYQSIVLPSEYFEEKYEY